MSASRERERERESVHVLLKCTDPEKHFFSKFKRFVFSRDRGDNGPRPSLSDLCMNNYKNVPPLSLCMIVSSCLILLIHVFSLSPTQLIKCTHKYESIMSFLSFMFYITSLVDVTFQGNLFFFYYLYSCHTYITQDFCE